MAKGNGGVKYPDPFNEVGSKDPNVPDVMGDGIYYNGFDEVLKMHLSMDGADLTTSSNAEASHDIYGGPTVGEANPAGMGGMGGKK